MPDPWRQPGPSSSPADRASVHQRLSEFAVWFDGEFDKLLRVSRQVQAPALRAEKEAPSRLVEAVRYAALGPGKRIRPFLTVRSCELTGGKAADALLAAAAVECVHAFSLVHDDLPAMDDDALRRGRATCHRAFDEATATLAGDALAVLAFEFLARQAVEPARCQQMVRVLAESVGWRGMIGGQAADMEGQSQPPTAGLVHSIHDRKTARLFEAACRLGVLAGGGEPAAQDALGSYGRWLGRAFQIADDLLDVTSTADKAGKETGKDAAARKQALHRCVGEEASRTAAQDAAAAAIEAIAAFRAEADDLRTLARYVVDRDY